MRLRLLSIDQRLKNFIEKIMVAKEVVVNYYNINPIWVQHASIHVKKYWYRTQVKKGNCQDIL